MKSKKIKIVFFGTPEFAVPSLKALCRKEFDILLVVTRPDQPVGRKQKLTSSAVKVEAKKSALLAVDNIKDLKSKIRYKKPDIGIVVAYGRLIPKEILDLFPYGCLNIHPSLLPKYRGSSPIQTAILNGDSQTGVSIIKLDEKMDHGAIISQIQYPISNKDTYESLSEKLAQAGAELLVKTLPDYLSGKIKPVPQNDSQATFTKILKRENGRISWNKSAVEIERATRAYWPWPGCYGNVKIKNKELRIKLIEAEVVPDSFADALASNCSADALASADAEAKPSAQRVGKLRNQNGQLFTRDKNLYVNCGQGILRIKKIQPEGKKIMTEAEYINGYLR